MFIVNIFLIDSLKRAFSFISLQKFCKTLSSSFLFYTFGLGMKFKFLFKSLYSLYEKENVVRLTTFPSR